MLFQVSAIDLSLSSGAALICQTEFGPDRSSRSGAA